MVFEGVCLRSTEVDRGRDRKEVMFGGPDGFGSSELDEIVHSDAPDRMELVLRLAYHLILVRRRMHKQ